MFMELLLHTKKSYKLILTYNISNVHDMFKLDHDIEDILGPSEIEDIRGNIRSLEYENLTQEIMNDALHNLKQLIKTYNIDIDIIEV